MWEFVLLGVPILCCCCPVGDRVVGVCGSAVWTVCLATGLVVDWVCGSFRGFVGLPVCPGLELFLT